VHLFVVACSAVVICICCFVVRATLEGPPPTNPACRGCCPQQQLSHQVKKVSRVVSVATVALLLSPCFIPIAATTAMDGFIAM
jgi:hypothetical protein